MGDHQLVYTGRNLPRPRFRRGDWSQNRWYIIIALNRDKTDPFVFLYSYYLESYSILSWLPSRLMAPSYHIRCWQGCVRHSILKMKMMSLVPQRSQMTVRVNRRPLTYRPVRACVKMVTTTVMTKMAMTKRTKMSSKCMLSLLSLQMLSRMRQRVLRKEQMASTEGFSAVLFALGSFI